MSAFFLDLLMVAILGFCIWQGYKKGLILTVAGVAVVFLSVFLAGQVASANADNVSERLYQIMSWIGGDEIEEASRGKGKIDEITNKSTISEIAKEAYLSLGISESEVDQIVLKALDNLEDAETDAREALTGALLYAITYLALCILAFIIFMVGLTLLTHFLSATFKLPVLNLVDTIGGSAAGLLYGLLIVSFVAWGARYLGMLIEPEVLSETNILSFFVNHNMLDSVLSYISGK